MDLVEHALNTLRQVYRPMRGRSRSAHTDRSRFVLGVLPAACPGQHLKGRPPQGAHHRDRADGDVSRSTAKAMGTLPARSGHGHISAALAFTIQYVGDVGIVHQFPWIASLLALCEHVLVVCYRTRRPTSRCSLLGRDRDAGDGMLDEQNPLNMERGSISLLVIFLSIASHAQYGAVDLSFNSIDDGEYGDGAMNFHSVSIAPVGQVLQAFEFEDGRLLVSGSYRTYNGYSPGKPTLMGSDGSRDSSFEIVMPTGMWLNRIMPLPDGGILASVGINTANVLWRFDPDGQRDTGFEVVCNSGIQQIALLPDGRIAIGGLFTMVAGEPRGYIAVLSQDGNLDTTFAAGSGADSWVRAFLVMSDGSLLVGGVFTTFNGMPRKGLVRLTPSGELDGTYDPMMIAFEGSSVNTLALDGEGRLLVGGGFQINDPVQWDHLGRFLPDGSPDTTFDTGSGPSDLVFCVAPLPNGRILVGGRFSSFNGHPRKALACLYGNGEIDGTYDALIDAYFSPLMNVILPLTNGDVLIGGRLNSVQGRFRMGLARLNADGTLRDDFNPGRGPGGLVNGMGLMEDGRIAIVGDFISYNDSHRPYLAFLTADGGIHPQFDGGEGPNARISVMARLVDDRLFLAGDLTTYDGVPVPRMAFVNAYGALVPAELPTTVIQPGHHFTAAHATPDGGVIVAIAQNDPLNGITSSLFKLLPNGSIDPNFTPPEPNFGSIRAIAIQSDGRILIGGSMTMSGSGSKGIARLMPSGALDYGFTPGPGIAPANSAVVYAIEPLSDGRIVIGGWFTYFQGEPVGHIACMDADGMMNNGFPSLGVTSGFPGYEPVIHSIEELADGRIVLSGWFSTYGGVSHAGMVVAMPDGTPDLSFSIGTGPSYTSIPYIRQVLVEPSGNCLIHGLFDRIDGMPRHRIARMLDSGGVSIAEQPVGSGIQVWPNPVSDVLHVSEPINGVLVDNGGRRIRELSMTATVSFNGLMPGTYFIQDQSGNTIKVVKQ
jgi:uncharacterized delta-60 repeat protein